MLTPSPRIAAFIQGFETLRLEAYKPTPNDVPTIGWGATGPDVKLGVSWTQAEAEARFAADLATFGRGVSAAIGAVATAQNEFDAMVSLAFNIGLKNFASSSVLVRHKAGDHQAAALAFGLWNKQRTPVGLVALDGLTRRRAAEAAIYLEQSKRLTLASAQNKGLLPSSEEPFGKAR